MHGGSQIACPQTSAAYSISFQTEEKTMSWRDTWPEERKVRTDLHLLRAFSPLWIMQLHWWTSQQENQQNNSHSSISSHSVLLYTMILDQRVLVGMTDSQVQVWVYSSFRLTVFSVCQMFPVLFFFFLVCLFCFLLFHFSCLKPHCLKPTGST